MRYTAAILDVDGTLLDSNDAHARAFVDARGAYLPPGPISEELASIRPLELPSSNPQTLHLAVTIYPAVSILSTNSRQLKTQLGAVRIEKCCISLKLKLFNVR